MAVIRQKVIARYFFVVLSLLWISTAAANELPSSDALPRRPFLGLTADPAPDHHVRVSKVVPDSPAARSGFAVGDILLALNGSPVESVATFLAGVKSFKTGDHLICRVRRGDKEMALDWYIRALDWLSRNPEPDPSCPCPSMPPAISGVIRTTQARAPGLPIPLPAC